MATYTANSYTLNPPKNLVSGDQSMSGQYNSAAQVVTSGDLIKLAKIPHGATVIAFTEDHSTGATQMALKFGFARIGAVAGDGSLLAGQTSIIIASSNQAAKNRESVVGGLPLVVSVTDADPNRYADLIIKSAGTTPTTSLIVNWVVIYRMDP